MTGPTQPVPPDVPDLTEQAATITAITTHPAFLQLVREIEAEPEDQRMQKAESIATVDELRARGIPVPPDLRLTTRYFENPGDPVIQEHTISSSTAPGATVPVPELDKPWTICGSAGFFVCVSVGREY